jgi:hypothetical protein
MAAKALSNNSDNSNANTNNGLLGHLLNTSIKEDDDNSETKAGMAHNQALE